MKYHHHSRSRRLLPRVLLTALGLVLIVSSGCHDDDDDETNFNSFVLNLFDDTSDTGAPVSINGEEFKFNENPNAFASLFE
ncbi:MAG: hypothetical protein FJ299_04110 [Planctomycetes bacterium]|nr:hypothetical protein [Planctomycetota bacterium]